MNRLLFSFLLSLLSLSLTVKGQDNIHFQNITTKNGLSNNTVLDIAQDKYGRIWFATYDGVTIFDGTRFKVIRNIPEKNKIPSGKADHIVVDAQGNVWVLFENFQLVRIINDDGDCVKYDLFDNIENKDSGIEQSTNGDLLVRFNETLFMYDQISDSFIKFKYSLDSISTPGNRYTDEAKLKLHHTCPDVKIFSAFCSNYSHTIWIASLNHGFFKINGNGFSEVVNFSKENNDVIKTNEFYSVFIDNSGNIWSGSKDHGIYLGIPQNSSFDHINSNSTIGTIRAICKDNKERLWIGSYNNGIYVYDKGRMKHIDLSGHNRSLKWNWIRSIHRSSDGNMWVGSYDGLCKIDPKTFCVEYFAPGPNSVSKGRIYSIEEEPNGNMFIGEWGALTIYNPAKGYFRHVSTIKNKIRKLLLSSSGELWIGTESSGIFVLDTTSYKVLGHYTMSGGNSSGINSNSIFELTEDSYGNIWIGTFGGLSCFSKPGNLKNISWVNENLPSTLIYKILIDSKRQLWCSTTKGIVKVDVDNKMVRVYDKAEGYNIYEFSEGAALKDAAGNMYFGGVNGICRFHPDSVKKDKHVPQIRLKAIMINNRLKEMPIALSGDSIYRFLPYQNDLSFSLKPILVNNPDKNTIAWKLVPKDGHFNYRKGSGFIIDYHNLHPGEYQLITRTANADGVWSVPETSFMFRIEKPFWQKYYFLISVLFLLIAIVLLFIHFRYIKIKKKNRLLEGIIKKRTEKIERQKLELEKANKILEIKNMKVLAQRDQILAQRDHLLEMHQKLEESDYLKLKLFTNISHDIRTPLSLIHAPLKELIRDESTPPAHIPLLRRMLSNSNYILKLLEQVLDKKKLEMGGAVLVLTQGDIVRSCRTIVDSFSDQAKLNNLKLTFNAVPGTYHLRYDHDKLQQILSNLLANAIKFTLKGGEIHCNFKIQQNFIEIQVCDTGIGIPPDRIKYIFDRYYQIGKSDNNDTQGVGVGLSMVKDFVGLFNGRIEVQSTEGNGSLFEVKLPVTLPRQKEHRISNFLPDELNVCDLSPYPIDLPGNKKVTTILLVEDNVELRSYLKDLLEKHYHVIDVQNGLEALEYLKKHTHIGLILSDWIMPGMDGIELCRTLKKKTKFRSVPFVMLTALTDIDNQIEGYLAGIEEYIPKPFDPELLLLKVSSILKREVQLKKAFQVEGAIQPQNIPVKTYDEKLLERIMALLEKELSNPDFGQADLSDELGMTPTRLYRKLRELTQMSPNDFIRSVRIQRAEQLLKNKNLIINEISDMVGFNDPKYFSRCFSRTFGMSPSKYRDELMESRKS